VPAPHNAGIDTDQPDDIDDARQDGNDSCPGPVALQQRDDPYTASRSHGIRRACAGAATAQSRCCEMLNTLPSGARTKNRRTPQGSVVSGCAISYPRRLASSNAASTSSTLIEATGFSGAVLSWVTSWRCAPVSGDVYRATHPMLNSSMLSPRKSA